jgi:hypothetical protein
MFDQLIFDAFIGERAGGIEAESLEVAASTSIAATPPASIASTNSVRLSNGKSSPPQRPSRWA